MKYKIITYCRICKFKNLKPLLDLGKLVSCGTFPKIKKRHPPKVPLRIVMCNNCKLVQTKHNYDQNSLFRGNYGYRSGINESMRRHLKEIVKNLKKKIKLFKGDIVLDIGSNDGTTLKYYKNKKIIRVGIDPTINKFKKNYPKDIITSSNFFSYKNYKKLKLNKKAKIITSIAMFYDLNDPNIFVQDIVKVLDKDGIWLTEQSYLPTKVERKSFDTICHEHLEYYTLKQIDFLAKKHAMRIVDVKINDINGGSFQVMLCHKNSSLSSKRRKILKILKQEKLKGYHGSIPIKKLIIKIKKIKAKVINFLIKNKNEGKIVHGYGASTKGNTLLQYFNISKDLITAIADRNKDKFGHCTPGSNIPIISEDKSRLLRPDYYFVLPWHFYKNFINREKKYLKRGGKFVFPLPNFKIVSK